MDGDMGMLSPTIITDLFLPHCILDDNAMQVFPLGSLFRWHCLVSNHAGCKQYHVYDVPFFKCCKCRHGRSAHCFTYKQFPTTMTKTELSPVIAPSLSPTTAVSLESLFFPNVCISLLRGIYEPLYDWSKENYSWWIRWCIANRCDAQIEISIDIKHESSPGSHP